MNLIDTSPLVALFDPADFSHRHGVEILKTIREPIGTTIPVLTEAFHLLSPGSTGSQRLMDFIKENGLVVWFLNNAMLERAFELMVHYADTPMDFADASLVVMAETLGVSKIFTIDRTDFAIYRIKRGHKYHAFEVIN